MLALFLKKLRSPRLWRFAAVGFSGVFVNMGVLALLAEVFKVPDVWASAAAIELSIIWNFLLNNAWTFRDKNEQAKAGFLQRMVTYNVVSLVGMAIQLGCFVGLNQVFMQLMNLSEPGLWKYPSQLVGIGVAMAWNLLSNFYFTWAQAKPAPEATEHAREQL